MGEAAIAPAASPTVNANLLVLQAQHQLDYLGPDTADISFGIQYDGLPSISIGTRTTGTIAARIQK
jgi:hypothetical protein